MQIILQEKTAKANDPYCYTLNLSACGKSGGGHK